MNVSMLAVSMGGAVAVPSIPLKLGFDEWVIFFCTLAIIVMAYGIRAARSKAGSPPSFMQRGGQGGEKDGEGAASGVEPATDQHGSLEGDHQQE